MSRLIYSGYKYLHIAIVLHLVCKALGKDDAAKAQSEDTPRTRALPSVVRAHRPDDHVRRRLHHVDGFLNLFGDGDAVVHVTALEDLIERDRVAVGMQHDARKVLAPGRLVAVERNAERGALGDVAADVGRAGVHGLLRGFVEELGREIQARRQGLKSTLVTVFQAVSQILSVRGGRRRRRRRSCAAV
jgi:hypothetical protein